MIYGMFLSFNANNIRFRYAKVYIDTFIMILKILSQEESILNEQGNRMDEKLLNNNNMFLKPKH